MIVVPMIAAACFLGLHDPPNVSARAVSRKRATRSAQNRENYERIRSKYLGDSL